MTTLITDPLIKMLHAPTVAGYRITFESRQFVITAYADNGKTVARRFFERTSPMAAAHFLERLHTDDGFAEDQMDLIRRAHWYVAMACVIAEASQRVSNMDRPMECEQPLGAGEKAILGHAQDHLVIAMRSMMSASEDLGWFAASTGA
jgi:hypothetical protein